MSYPFFLSLGILQWALKSLLKNLCQEQVSLSELIVLNTT